MACCPIAPEIAENHRQVWTEYEGARPLQSLDFHRQVVSDLGCLPLTDFLQIYHHPDLVWESVPKTTGKDLLQIVYIKGQGCTLLKWPFASQWPNLDRP